MAGSAVCLSAIMLTLQNISNALSLMLFQRMRKLEPRALHQTGSFFKLINWRTNTRERHRILWITRRSNCLEIRLPYQQIKMTNSVRSSCIFNHSLWKRRVIYKGTLLLLDRASRQRSVGLTFHIVVGSSGHRLISWGACEINLQWTPCFTEP